jgi:hypothetical protein
MVENARRFGIGSLWWKIEEESISDADIVPYVMGPKYRHLVPDFLSGLQRFSVE